MQRLREDIRTVHRYYDNMKKCKDEKFIDTDLSVFYHNYIKEFKSYEGGEKASIETLSELIELRQTQQINPICKTYNVDVSSVIADDFNEIVIEKIYKKVENLKALKDKVLNNDDECLWVKRVETIILDKYINGYELLIFIVSVYSEKMLNNFFKKYNYFYDNATMPLRQKLNL